tara:strand:+ start:178 stop:609 length:432 start_codon:yes stop_codon:yes gene_type:complete
MSLIPGSDYAGGGVLPGYSNPVPTQEKQRRKPKQIPIPPQQPQYTSIADVVRDYKAGNISYNQAYNILRNQFGLSDNDIQDVMEEIEPIGAPEAPPEKPQPEPSPQAEAEPSDSGIMLSEDQRFLLIGLLVIGIGSRMIIKRD